MKKFLSKPATILVLWSCFSMYVIVDANNNDNYTTCTPIKPLAVKYLASKTVYEDARKLREQMDQTRAFWSLGLSKTKRSSLERLDKNLRQKEGCTPKMFYFIGRHSARFPSEQDIIDYSGDVAKLVEAIQTKSRCPEQVEAYINWRSQMQPEHDNLITGLGAREERDIARRFKHLYPEFFNVNSSLVEIGVTPAIRTAQTAFEFMQEVDGFVLPDYRGDDEAQKLLRNPSFNYTEYDQPDVRRYHSFRHIIANHQAPFLDFHKQCLAFSGKKGKRDKYLELIKDPELKQTMANKIEQKLGLDKNTISCATVYSIYSICKYENAMQIPSIWCDLFDERDIEILEYIADASSYKKFAYGPMAKSKQAYPAIVDLMGAVKRTIKDQDDKLAKSYFHFTHATPLYKLLASFELFRDDESYSEAAITRFHEKLQIPRNRKWRTSALCPFSANLAFTVYQCQKSSKQQVKHKIVASVTERPVKLGGCKDIACDAELFLQNYASMQNYDMAKICGSD